MRSRQNLANALLRSKVLTPALLHFSTLEIQSSRFCSILHTFFAIPRAFFFWKEVKDKHATSNRRLDLDRTKAAETHPD